MEAVMIERYIELIENGLEGIWVYEGVPAQYISFEKPSTIGGLGKLILSATADLKEPQTIEYEVVFVENPNPLGGDVVFINIFVKTSNQKIQYQLVINFLNSWIGAMYLIDPQGRYLHYHRLEPRIMEPLTESHSL